MKKILVVYALFAALILMISCGSSSSSDNNSVTNFGKLGSECYPNKTCDEGLICDEENNVCVEDSENPIHDSDASLEQTDDNADTSSEQNDNDSGDTNPDDTDSTPDNDADSGDSAPDDTDSTPNNDADSGDSAPDSDDGDTANENPGNLPECSPTSATPCVDPETDLIWSGKSTETMLWADAVNYCKDMNEGGFSDWRLPTISELRTLIQNCSKTERGGTCGVTDDCLSYSECRNDDCGGCRIDENNPGQYSKFGESGWFWSSSTRSDSTDIAWFVDFYGGYVGNASKDLGYDVRCVR